MRSPTGSIVAAIAFLTLAACSDRNPLAPGSSSRPAPGASAALNVVASSGDIDMISVEAQFIGHKAPMLYDFPLQSGSSSLSLALPSAEGYQLVIRGYDRYGRQTHEANQSVSYIAVGENRPLQVKLAPTIDGAPAATVQFDVIGQTPAPDGVQIYMKASAKELLEGQSMSLSAQVVDASGVPIALKPGDLTWSISDPSIGRLMVNPEKPASASVLALHTGYADIVSMYKGYPHHWPVNFLLDPYVKISAGYDFACGLRQSGALYCWGNNNVQQLGLVTAANTCPVFSRSYNCSDVPVRVTTRLFSTMTTGWYHACAIEQGTNDTYCWADNYYGELGIGTKGAVQLPTRISSGPQFKQISAGMSHTCAIAIANSEAFCWGDNYWGELGVGSYGQNNNPSTHYLTVTEAVSPTLVPNYGGWSTIVAGEEFTCGINGGGTMCWGDYGYGQVGLGPNFPGTTSAPRNVNATFAPATLTSLSANTIGATMCGITNGNAAWCWGSNGGEKLGVPGAGAAATEPTAVSGGHNFVSIANGMYHSCAVDNASQVFCWGFLLDGRTGQPTASTTNPTPIAVTVAGVSFASVVTGNAFSCALTTGGRIYCWGSNTLGQLGNAAINAGTNVPQLVFGS